jgi:DNA polymerase III delta subunit
MPNKVYLGNSTRLNNYYDLEKQGANFVFFNDYDSTELLENFNFESFFNKAQKFIIRSDIQHFKDFILNVSKNDNTFVYLIDGADAKDMKKALGDDPSLKIEFDIEFVKNVEKGEFKGYIEKYFKDNYIECDTSIIEYLLNIVGDDFDFLNDILKKTSFLYANTRLKQDNLITLIGFDYNLDIFKMVDYFFDEKVGAFISFLNYMNQRNADFSKLFYILAKEMRKAIFVNELVKDKSYTNDDIYKITGVFSKKVDMYNKFSEKYYNPLYSILIDMPQYDIMFKYKKLSLYSIIVSITYRLFFNK